MKGARRVAESVLRGKIYDIQGFSVHDGPGIRTTVFLKGCPLHCPWCHSPESQAFQTQMSYMQMRCVGLEKCGLCLKVCPAGALTPGETELSPVDQSPIQRVKWSRAKCMQCGACAKACSPQALFLCGTDYTVDEVLERVLRDKSFYESSGGGVTVSGGEPLSQLDFTAALLQALKENGIHTALDTTGFAPAASVERVLPFTDLFLYDLKHMDSGEHERVTGVPNGPIHANARWLAAHGGKLQVRVPVIPGFNETEENLRATAQFCQELGQAVEVVQLLPYHHFGAAKYERIQMYDPMPADLQPPSDEKMQEYAEMMRGYGLHVIIH